jgi:4'-phosphopantetheinyl transferase
MDADWTPAARPPPLGADDVHVWQASLDVATELADRLAACLDDDERQRAGRFHFRRDRNRYLVGRGRLRQMLGAYLHVAPEGVRFQYSKVGKPALSEGSGSADLRFNVTHSHGLALYALTRGRDVGVDVERVRSDLAWNELAERYFAPTEIAELMALPPDRQRLAFFTCWTRKEAYVKALGLGLSVPLDGFAVTLAPDRPPALIGTAHDPTQCERWELRELEPAAGFVGAMAVEGRGWRLWHGRWVDNP